ncbi:hypothetical protein LWC33_18370 [Pseudonocardia sp. RS11V-5]|uniref:hypothetical protein n=1 Tax=Pseudonocardia terrae TaxID=2905831 RepID=UPI001E39F74A|nr:hypothetical protein [Pseudonocardia terrae]MCE3553415.1 hypothetical protein [Pseudonocardia terrae]
MSDTVRAVEEGPDRALTAPPPPADGALGKSYTYLRVAIVGLLIALGVAVCYQSSRQGLFLASVSAYYYTPAQAIFVGALIGLGAAMIALRGRHPAEDTLLNLGGAFAAVVAVVPTSRGVDYQTAVEACRQGLTPLLTQRATTRFDCPTVLSLAEATRANVQNNVFALLVVGALGLVATLGFAARDRVLRARAFLIGFSAVALVWVIGLVAFTAGLDLLIARAHYLAAILLFVCILAVAVINATRRRTEEDTAALSPGWTLDAPTVGRAMLRKPRQFDRYAWVAWVMLIGAVGGGVLWWVGVISLFWLEIFVALLFAVFWMVQTIEQLPPQPAQPGPSSVR